MRAYAGVALGTGLLMLATAAQAETPIEAPGPAGPLKGVLLTAQGVNAPIVLIIPGSGPTDHDGNNRHDLRASTYRLIAEGFATPGISSVRIDKRGMFGSASAIQDGNAVTFSDYATDVASWVAVIRSRAKQDCVWVLGHSEGGLVALAAAQRVPNLCGLLLVATAGRPLAEVVREQLKANPANVPILDQALAAVDRLESGLRVDTSGIHPALLPLFRPQVQGFLIDAFSYDPAKLLRNYKGPVLILQGKQDMQTNVADAELLLGANSNAKLVILPEANHVLKTVVSADRAANIATYANPNLPLAEGVIDTLAEFVMSNTGKVR